MLLRPILSRLRKPQGVANFCILRNGEPAIFSPENSISPSSSKEKSLEKGYVVSFLVNSCGLSAESAVSASKKVHFDGPEKPNAVLEFLEKQGFSKSQISELVRRHPELLVSKPEKSLSPRIEFFLQTGISEKDVITTFIRHPYLLLRNKDRMALIYNYVEDLIGAVKARALLMDGGSWAFSVDPGTLIPNVDFLMKLGVPLHNIELALFRCAPMFYSKHDDFRRTVEEVKQMGFDRLQFLFILAIKVRTGKRNLSLWDGCCRAYSKWGWSMDDIYTAFRKHPSCMILSEKKISAVMEFLVNEVGLDPRSVVYCPGVLFYSMEKRIIPRCSIVHLLCLKGLVKKDWNLSSVLHLVEKDFVEKYVTRFAEELPQICDIYQEKLGLSSKVKIFGLLSLLLSRNAKSHSVDVPFQYIVKLATFSII